MHIPNHNFTLVRLQEEKKNCYLNSSLTSAFHLNAGATKLFPSAIVPDIFQKLVNYNANNKLGLFTTLVYLCTKNVS